MPFETLVPSQAPRAHIRSAHGLLGAGSWPVVVARNCASCIVGGEDDLVTRML